MINHLHDLFTSTMPDHASSLHDTVIMIFNMLLATLTH